MKLINRMLALTAVSAFFCEMLNAAGLEKEAADSAAFGLIKANTGVSLPTPRASRIRGESAAGVDELFKYMGDIFKAPKAMLLDMGSAKSATPVVPGRTGDVLYSFRLDSILNSYIDAGLSFKTSDGAIVRLSGYTAANCPAGGQACADKERFFLILAVGREEFHFVKATDVVNAFLASGSSKVNIGADEYTVKIHARFPINSSKIEITRGGAVVFDATLKQLADAVMGKGANIKLGRTYQLAYGNELIQGKDGARFNDKLVIVLSPVGVDGFYFLNRSDITPDGVTYPEMEPGYGFRIVGGALEIFKLL